MSKTSTDETIRPASVVEPHRWPTGHANHPYDTAFGCPRNFLQNRFVYVVISARARGLSIGVNMIPDKRCNFSCAYCEVNFTEPAREKTLDVAVMAEELEQTLAFVHAGRLAEHPWYQGLPPEMLVLRQVNLSGDGEPTLCPWFVEALQTVVHVRARAGLPFFKLVLITNSTGLDLPHVQEGLRLLTRRDEVWAKLDGGTQAYLQRVNKLDCPIEKILSNILLVARQRPIVIQSLFPLINGVEPPEEEILEYAQRLKELADAGAQISLVQIYSATRPTPRSECGHLELKSLSRIARTVRQKTGLLAEVF
jgi:wyosine [tRNA(Phe)-imidazoG37] synthetase (radical SAM superfamily)